jgi:hypothetical protein
MAGAGNVAAAPATAPARVKKLRRSMAHFLWFFRVSAVARYVRVTKKPHPGRVGPGRHKMLILQQWQLEIGQAKASFPKKNNVR